METTSESEQRVPKSGVPDLTDREHRQAVLDELERVLNGKHFRNSGRAKQFLRHIVEKKLDDHCDDLKERSIGTELFHRPSDYSTGDDPVVRVQAGLVRRRLEQNYQEEQGNSPVRIELPLGSYAPEFHWLSSDRSDALPSEGDPVPDPTPPKRSPKQRLLIALAVALVLIFGVCAAIVSMHRKHQESTMEKFWSPAFNAPRPLLICLGDRVSYQPKLQLYDQYERQHPGTFQTETQRTNNPLPLDPAEKIAWGDMQIITEWGITKGDLSSTVTLATFLGRIGKPIDLRVGDAEYSYRELRDFPAILVGAFNNQWTMNLMSDLRFVFVEQNGRIEIQDKKSLGQVWFSDYHKSDYAMVSRLLDPKTGQFTIIVAGLTSRGTEAAGEFVTNPSELEEGLHAAPQDWQTKNLELVLETDVTEGVSGPPRVVASYYW